MSEPNGPERKIILRNGTGTEEVFVPEQTLLDLLAERDRLRRERDALKRERDELLATLHHVLAKDVKPLTAEELHDIQTKGISEEEFLREIDRLFPPRAARG